MSERTIRSVGADRRTAPPDGATVLVIYVVLLLGLPSRLIFAPLGGAGTPAQILGMCGLGWWIWHQVARSAPARVAVNPVRWAALLFAAAMLASFVKGTTRPIPGDELASSQLGLLAVLGWMGVLLVAHDGPITRERLDRVLSAISLGGGLVALLGLAQFATGLAITDKITIPGLTLNNALVSLGTRSGFNRPAGTALHAIEFGVVITMILPLCLHYALHNSRGHGMLRRWFPVAAIAFAVPISISRSAIVGLLVGLVVMLPTWSSAVRRGAAVVAASVMGIVFVLVPGMIGTLAGLFTGVGQDDSARSRTDSYGLAAEFIAGSPWFGRGFLTFLPKYRILDNQYLGLLIDAGFVGLTTFLALLVTGMVAAQMARRRTATAEGKDLAQAVTAAIAVSAVSFALFDGFAFPMFASASFLMVGAAGCLLRLAPAPGHDTT